ncbi:MAG: abortive infection family protein [Deltaproteobacteria bacterium]
MEFDAADVPVDPNYTPSTSGERRSLVEKYYHTVDWTKWNDVRKILTVYENVLSHLEGLVESGIEWADTSFRSLRKWIERDGYKYNDGRLVPIGKYPTLEDISDNTYIFDIPELHRQIERMKSAIEDDPGLAIGTAKELVETTCKTILDERGIKFDENADICKLVKEARKSLGLIPDTIPNSAKGSEIIRRLLSNLGNVAQGLGELRNLYGTGHGKHGKSKGLNPRHARLAVGAASTLALFLFETHQERTI